MSIPETQMLYLNCIKGEGVAPDHVEKYLSDQMRWKLIDPLCGMVAGCCGAFERISPSRFVQRGHGSNQRISARSF